MKKLIIALILFFGVNPLYAGYVDNGNGTVTDTSTGLMWQQATPNNTMNWQNALDYCENLTLAGYSDWRLPTVEELRSIVDYSRYNPSIDTVFFKDTFASLYWSSSTRAHNVGNAWGVSFSNGYASYGYGKDYAYYVRAVRLGQSVIGSFGHLAISPTSRSVVNASGSTTFAVSNTDTGTMAWSAVVTSGGDWLSISSGSSGSNAGTITCSYSANTTTSSRTGIIRVTANGAEGSPQDLTVVQAAGGSKPTVQTGAAGTVATNSATINGTINPNGISTTYYFQYGTTTTYGSVTPGADAGSATTVKTVTANLTGLTANTNYHFRLVATNSIGMVYGEDKSFTTTKKPDPDPQPDPEPDPDPDPQPTSGMRKAIILAGGGGNTTLYPYSNKLCQQMYRLLKQRGFTDDDIIYMNPQPPDIDANGYLEPELLDYNLFEPQKHLKEAFAKAAQSFVQNGNQGQFIFYVHGHADKDYLKITRDYEISAAELKALINTVPASVPQVIILDTCYSGSFMDELAGTANGQQNRIVVTSADDKTVAWNTSAMGFSDKFLRSLGQGYTLQVAFESAEDMIKANSKYFGEQSPQLDDNGDGFYDSADGVQASSIYIGKEGVQAADPPSIQSVHPVMEISEGRADGVIWVKTSPTGEGRIKTVKAVLMPPDFKPIQYEGQETQFSEISLELKYNGADDRYQVTYDNFRQKGRWKTAYQAQGLDGQWSEVRFGEVNAGGVTNALAVSVGFNQSEYLVSDTLLFDVTLNGKENINLYVALFFPQGYFMSFAYPFALSFPNQLIPYQSNIAINGLKTFNILELTLPKELDKGIYIGCAVAAQAGSDPWAVEKWFCYDCKTFELR